MFCALVLQHLQGRISSAPSARSDCCGTRPPPTPLLWPAPTPRTSSAAARRCFRTASLTPRQERRRQGLGQLWSVQRPGGCTQPRRSWPKGQPRHRSSRPAVSARWCHSVGSLQRLRRQLLSWRAGGFPQSTRCSQRSSARAAVPPPTTCTPSILQHCPRARRWQGPGCDGRLRKSRQLMRDRNPLNLAHQVGALPYSNAS